MGIRNLQCPANAVRPPAPPAPPMRTDAERIALASAPRKHAKHKTDTEDSFVPGLLIGSAIGAMIGFHL